MLLAQRCTMTQYSSTASKTLLQCSSTTPKALLSGFCAKAVLPCFMVFALFLHFFHLVWPSLVLLAFKTYFLHNYIKTTSKYIKSNKNIPKTEANKSFFKCFSPTQTKCYGLAHYLIRVIWVEETYNPNKWVWLNEFLDPTQLNPTQPNLQTPLLNISYEIIGSRHLELWTTSLLWLLCFLLYG